MKYFRVSIPSLPKQRTRILTLHISFICIFIKKIARDIKRLKMYFLFNNHHFFYTLKDTFLS